MIETPTSIKSEFEYVMSVEKLASQDDSLIIAGYASSGSMDLDGQIMDQGALHRAWDKFMKNPVVRFMHGRDSAHPGAVGRVIPEYTDSSGATHFTKFDRGDKPYVVIKISDAPDVQSIRTKIQEGLYTGLSIQGMARKTIEYSKKLGRAVERLFVVSLQEISVVDVPSNTDSLFNVLKSACKGDACGIGIGNEANADPVDITIKGGNVMTDFTKEDMAGLIRSTLTDMTKEQELVQKAAAHDTLKIDNAKLKTEIETIRTEFEAFKKSVDPATGGADEATAMKAEVADLKEKIEKLASTPFFKGQIGDEVANAGQNPDVETIVPGGHLVSTLKASRRRS